MHVRLLACDMDWTSASNQKLEAGKACTRLDKTNFNSCRSLFKVTFSCSVQIYNSNQYSYSIVDFHSQTANICPDLNCFWSLYKAGGAFSKLICTQWSFYRQLQQSPCLNLPTSSSSAFSDCTEPISKLYCA